MAKYEVLKRLGHGGMGEVYLARDAELGRQVALKFLPAHLARDPAAHTRFVQEAIAASALKHVNVATIYEIGHESDATPFIAMEYCAGETLRQKIARGPLPVARAVDYALQIACGLQHAHEANVTSPDGVTRYGVVHRDIKPANAVVTEEGVVKILDFGLAKIADLTLTQTGTTLGTALYMSPEQAQGNAVDARTDLWSVGVVLYEMLAGRPPFGGGYEQAVFYAIIQEDYLPLPEHVPDSLVDVVARCLQKDPDARYPSARALVADLELIKQDLDDGDPASPRRVRRYPGRTKPFRRLAPPLAIATIATLLIAAAVWMLRPPHEQTIAVLPFKLYGPNKSTQSVAAGLHEMLTSGLLGVGRMQQTLRVLPVSELGASDTTADALARRGVTHVVRGIVLTDGDHVRFDISLEDTRHRKVIDSQRITQRNTSTFALQDSVLAVLIGMLEVNLQPDQRAVLFAGGTKNPQANRYYLEGLGTLRQGSGSEEDARLAVSLFELALEQDPRFALAEAGLGEAYWKWYDKTNAPQLGDSAIQHSQHALALRDDLAGVHITIGLTHYKRGNLTEALRAYDRARVLEPGNPEVYIGRGRVLRKLTRFDEARVDYQHALALDPHNWRAHFQLGLNDYDAGDMEGAIAHYEAGLALDSTNTTLLNAMAGAYFNQFDFARASALFDRVLALDPTHGNASSNVGTAHFYAGQYEQAAEWYRRLIARAPTDYDTYSYLADALYWAGDRAGAMEAYRTAIRLARTHVSLQSRNAQWLASLAGYFARLGEPDSAHVYLQRTFATLPVEGTDPITAFGIGETYVQLGELQQALPWIEQGLENNTGWVQVRYSPWLRPLHDDPTFQQMLLKYQPRD